MSTSKILALAAWAATTLPAFAGAGPLTTIYTLSGDADGAMPVGALIDQGGFLYGTTSFGGSADYPFGFGTVFKLVPSTGELTVLHAFGAAPDGETPAAGLLYHDGTLYGTTTYGGAYGLGTVFAVNAATGSETVLHSFVGGISDGRLPEASLVYYHDSLYGTTINGGSAGKGTVFELALKTGNVTVAYSFLGGTDGAIPNSLTLAPSGNLAYGTTQNGGGQGQYGVGTVFVFDLASHTETVLYGFKAQPDGQYPYGTVLYSGGTLYGTTDYGGPIENGPGPGTLFAVNAVTGAETILHNFDYDNGDGFNPLAGLIDHNGILYGTTMNGGDVGQGTVFSFDPSSGQETVLYSFSCYIGVPCPHGTFPEASLIYKAGSLYGTTFSGGTGTVCGNADQSLACGTIFQMKLKKTAK